MDNRSGDTTRDIKLKHWRGLVAHAQTIRTLSVASMALVSRAANSLALGQDLAPADVVKLERIAR